MTVQKICFSGEASSYNILEQNVILDPRCLGDDNRKLVCQDAAKSYLLEATLEPSNP
jgi:hypothetical protein